MPTRIESLFRALKSRQRAALIAYVTAGDPTPERTPGIVAALERGGVDLIELGVPFSDPIADGPVIQASSQRALENGMSFDKTLELLESARLEVPVVLFTYLNPVLAAGEDALTRAAASGASGILVTDIPVGADPEREAWLGDSPLSFIRLVAPTTPRERMAEITLHGSGFVYLIGRLGVTGTHQSTDAALPETIQRLRSTTSLPICVGFGISTPEHARNVGRIADGIVVGSALVKAAEQSARAVEDLTRSLREALDG